MTTFTLTYFYRASIPTAQQVLSARAVLNMVLEWETRKAYALTELVTFAIGVSVVIVVIVIAAFIFYELFRSEKNRFLIFLRPLLEAVFTDAIAFTPIESSRKVTIIFVGNQEHSSNRKIVRVWVRIYFSVLCGIAALWFLAVFSDALFYRKTGTCLDLSVRDTDSSCFLLSTRNVPPGVQEILDEEEEDAVPCQKVQNYLLLANITYDLEVLCYQSQLNPLVSIGIAYGATKSVIFGIINTLAVLLKIFNTVRSKPRTVRVLLLMGQIVLTILIIIAIIAISSSLHEARGPRNTSFDYLRGERFYNFSVIILIAITTIVLLALFPWWAFEPLTQPVYVNEKDKLAYNNIQKAVLYLKFFSYFEVKKAPTAMNAEQDTEETAT